MPDAALPPPWRSHPETRLRRSRRSVIEREVHPKSCAPPSGAARSGTMQQEPNKIRVVAMVTWAAVPIHRPVLVARLRIMSPIC
jgi:hypothetical protein